MSQIADEICLQLAGRGIHPPEQVEEWKLELAYRLGYEDALRNYAIWQEGEQRIGGLGLLLRNVLEAFKEQDVPVRY